MIETLERREVKYGCVDPGWLLVKDEFARTALEAELRKQHGPETRVEVRTSEWRARQLGGLCSEYQREGLPFESQLIVDHLANIGAQARMPDWKQIEADWKQAETAKRDPFQELRETFWPYRACRGYCESMEELQLDVFYLLPFVASVVPWALWISAAVLRKAMEREWLRLSTDRPNDQETVSA